MRGANPLQQPVTVLGLPARVMDMLMAESVFTVGDALELHRKGSQGRIHNWGSSTSEVLEKAFVAKGVYMSIKSLVASAPIPRSKPVLLVANLPLEVLGLSTRATNCLHGEGLKTIGDVLAKTRQELLRIPNFGAVCLKELKEALAKFHLDT